MLKGRTEEQKKALATALSEALKDTLKVGDAHISVTIEDYTAVEWQDEFKREITDKPSAIYKAPAYDPKDLL
jgi:4-oxalocrotonate tautomerase